jgi:hypothetical protein
MAHARANRGSKGLVSAEAPTPVSPQTDDFDRRKTIMQIVEEVQGLGGQLDDALTKCHYSESIENRRLRMSRALISVANFISKTIDSNHANWFFELANHLADLNVGTTPVFLQASKKENRTVDSTALWVQRAMVAALVFKLGQKNHRNGKPSWKEAARQVAKNYPELAQLRGKKAGADLATSVHNWFHQFSNGLVKNEIASLVYDEHVQAIERRVS